VVAAGGVLQQHRHLGPEPAQRLAPADEPLALVVVGGDVAAVHDHRGRADRGRPGAGPGQQLADGIRMGLLAEARLITYGACT